MWTSPGIASSNTAGNSLPCSNSVVPSGSPGCDRTDEIAVGGSDK